MTTSSRTEMETSDKGEMTLKEFKQALIDFGRTCIPTELQNVIRIPGTSESTYMYLTNSDNKKVKEIIEANFGRASLSTQIATNTDINGLQVVEAFQADKDFNDRPASEILKSRDISKLLETEKSRVKNNIEKVLNDKRSSIFQLVALYRGTNLQKNKEYRLSQVARKLNTSFKTIVDYLNDQGIILENNPNTRLTQSMFDELSKEFSSSKSQDHDLTGEDIKAGLALQELLHNTERQFFVAGHDWEGQDQLPRFIEQGIWENGHEDKVTAAVNSANVGDVLFAKSTWVKGKTQGILTFKAIGIVTHNKLDGHILHVNWFEFENRIDLTIGSHYRHAFQSIGEQHKIDILIAVFKSIPRLNEIIESLSPRLYEDIDINILKSSSTNYWWINAAEKWTIDNLEIGQEESYSAIDASGKYKRYVRELKKGDLLIGYQAKDLKSIVGLLQITVETGKNDRYFFRLLYKFNNKTSLQELRKQPLFGESSLSKSLQGSLHKLSEELFDEIINTTELSINEENTVEFERQDYQTPITHDGIADTKDLLDIENDVRSFALLLAAKEVKPPIAIALFGRWGSGKSFFMKHLQKRVNELSEHQGFLVDPKNTEVKPPSGKTENFCSGIAQIEFNAWSYLDSNLWAGLVTSIFEKLNEYITDTTKSGVATLRVQEKLKERLKSLQSKKLSEEDRLNGLKNLKHSYAIESKKLKDSIQTNFSNHILKYINADENLRETHKAISEDKVLSKLEEKLKLEDLKREANIFKSFYRNLIKTKGLIKYMALALTTVVIAIYFNYWFNIEGLTWASFIPLLTGLGIDFEGLRKRYKNIKHYILKFNSIMEENIELEEQVVLHQNLVAHAENQISEAEQQITEIDNKIDDFEQYMENEIHQETIRDFVQSRADHADYKSKLGIVSIIRKDFEILSQLFYDWDKASSDINDKELKKDRQFIKDQFKTGRNLDRIILYIDDLDRCTDKKVLEVIQAVHLLMAFPLFNVVVGVDKRCVRNALLLKTKLAYLKIAPLDEIEDLGINMVTPGDYLEKIFQIPFELKEPHSRDIERLANHLLESQVEKIIEEIKEDETEEWFEKKLNQVEEINDEETGLKEQPLFKRTPSLDQIQNKVEYLEQLSTEEPRVLVSSAPDSLKLSEHEFKSIKEILFLVGNTPRTVKQYINIYWIIRAHKRPETKRIFNGDDHMAIMFLLAMKFGHCKGWAEELFKLIPINPNIELEEILNIIIKISKDSEDATMFKKQVSKLTGLPTVGTLLKLKGEIFSEHIEFVGRFSFDEEVQTRQLEEKV
jgi:hypothetical protein